MREITGRKDSFHSSQQRVGFEGIGMQQPRAERGGRSKRKENNPTQERARMEQENVEHSADVAGESPDVVVEGKVAHSAQVPSAESPSLVPVPKGKRMAVRELEMMRKMEEINAMEEIHVGGTTNIEAEVIGSIAGVAAQSVEGVASLGTASLRRTIRERMGSAERKARGVVVEVGSREALLDINVRVIYGYSIPIIVVKVRETVADRLLKLCGLLAKEINVNVSGIEFPDRAAGRVQ